MIKPTAFITWPQHIDFPLFRYKLHKFKEKFANVFICFTNLEQEENYRNFIQWKLPFATFTKPLNQRSDWRDDTIITLLNLPPFTEYCLFWEQDFLINNHKFMDTVLNTEHDFIYYEEGERIHPAFCLIRRSLIDRTSKDFAAHPDDLKLDHFGKFFNEVKAISKGIEIRELGLRERHDFYHMASLTQNYHNFLNDQPLYKSKEFLSYNYNTMLMDHQNPLFYKKCWSISEKYGYVEKETFITDFFPQLSST